MRVFKSGKIYRWHRQSDKLSAKSPVLPKESKPTGALEARPESLPRRWFCASLTPSGTISRLEADSVASLLDTANKSTLAWIDFWTEDLEKDAPVIAAELGFSGRLCSSLFGDYSVSYQDFDNELGLRLPAVQVARFDVKSSPLLLLLRKTFVLTIHPLTLDRRFARLRRYADVVLKKIPPNIAPEDKLTMLLMRIIDENNDRNFEELRKIEERGDELSENLTNPETPRTKLGLEIYQMKHALINYLNALWETIDVLHALRYGDAELVTGDPELLNKMTVLAEDVNRQIGLAEHMSEVLASGLEVLQSIYNNQLQALNNRMALVMTYLTILGTAVLVPNTLATIFSNSAFNMGPQDRWWYIALLVVSTVAATGTAYLWVKKKGFLPKRMD